MCAILRLLEITTKTRILSIYKLDQSASGRLKGLVFHPECLVSMTSQRKGDEYNPCQHLLNYRAKHGVSGFRIFQKCLRIRPPGRVSIKYDEKEVPQCAICGRAQGRLYSCLLCATIGCWVLPDVMHARSHALSRPGHELAVDVDRAEVFCCICNDQVYDPDFDKAIICAQSAALYQGRSNPKEQGINGFTGVSSRNDRENPLIIRDQCILDGSQKADKHRKRHRAQYRPWVPSPEEQMLLKHRSTPLREDACLPSGLRGLNNLGSTCFMNSVLQALLHTPPLRNYFLSDRHNRAVCQRRASHICLGCEMDEIFSAAFSGDRTPYSPSQFLYSWWQHASNLAGYEQQDAHEFFISTVDGIHANSGTTSPRAKHLQIGSAGDTDCRCIIHRVFSGLLRSDVTCLTCGFTSTTHDPCVDVSLDLESSIGYDKLSRDSFLANIESGKEVRGPSVSAFPGTSSLFGCLDRFTRPEKLGVNEKFFCKNCQLSQESIKQMSVRKLPLVLCFHIKRFEHSSTRNASRKIDKYVQFPCTLDMTPYLSSSIVRLRHGNRLLLNENEDYEQLPSSQFELFSVITHSGKLDAGHYLTFVRLGGQWYKCDDAWITRVSDEVVRASQGYMLFYVQKTLSYKASEVTLGTKDHCWIQENKNHLDIGRLSNPLLENGFSA